MPLTLTICRDEMREGWRINGRFVSDAYLDAMPGPEFERFQAFLNGGWRNAAAQDWPRTEPAALDDPDIVDVRLLQNDQRRDGQGVSGVRSDEEGGAEAWIG